MSQILIVEDEPIIRGALRKLLERHDHQVTEAGSVEDAAQHDFSAFDLIISDLRLPGAPGSDLVTAAAPTPVLIMTSYASLRSAVEIMRDGAVDYIPKPFDHDEMVSTVQRILALGPRRTVQQAAAPARPTNKQGTPEKVLQVGTSNATQALLAQAERVAKTDIPILIQGEASTGKQHLAKYIHQQSHRSNETLFVLNCATLPGAEQELEMFGGEASHLTGLLEDKPGLIAQANNSTLVLAEVESLSDTAQGRLLRLLDDGTLTPIGSTQRKQVDVRIIATSNQDLSALAAQNKFRQDLFYRLNVVPLQMPPLRKRGEDILLFAEEFLAQSIQRHQREPMTLLADAQQALCEHTWPGNLQELENAIERAVILCDGSSITAQDLALPPTQSAEPTATGAASTNHEPMEEMSLEDYFTRFVLENQDTMTETELAQKLGISRKNLWERRQRLGIPRNRNN